MPSPFQSPSDDTTTAAGWRDRLRASVAQFGEPSVLVPTAILTLTSLAGMRLYKSYLRRIPSIEHIRPEAFRKRSIFGRVTSVGDGDNFRVYHTPGGRWAGWGWLPGRRVPEKAALKGQTVS
jgi:hypothetical protein